MLEQEGQQDGKTRAGEGHHQCGFDDWQHCRAEETVKQRYRPNGGDSNSGIDSDKAGAMETGAAKQLSAYVKVTAPFFSFRKKRIYTVTVRSKPSSTQIPKTNNEKRCTTATNH